MSLDPVTAALDLGGKLLDKFVKDPEARDKAKLELLAMHQQGELQLLSAKAGIITAEATSENILASSWRPILMLTFGALIVARWFGFAAPNLTEAEYLALWDIVELGLGGYVVGRSAEKIMPQVAAVLKK